MTTRINLVTNQESEQIVDFKGDAGELTFRYNGSELDIYCGIGDKDALSSQVIRTVSAKGVQKALDNKRVQVALVLSKQMSKKNEITAAIEGVLLGAYKFTMYKSEKSEPLNNVEVATDNFTTNECTRIASVCESVNYARSLINENAHDVTPKRLAKEAKALSADGLIKVTVLDEEEMQKKGLGLIVAVGVGSPYPPRLIFMEYTGNKKSKETIAIVGKGVTFDSGGQNLKPTGSIETMRHDMAGAATVLGVMRAITLLEPAINVIGVIPSAHNNIGGLSFFPGDVYTAYNGKTVEILSTDAEGRLILADAISYCIDQYKPSKIIDLATLTGGVLSAFSDILAGLFSNDDTLSADLFTAGEKTSERLWRLPVYKEFSDSMKSDLADLRNISKLKKGHASSITGAAFIKEFADPTPWAHLDIAGTGWNEGGAKGEISQFATGFGVRLLLELLTGYSDKP